MRPYLETARAVCIALLAVSTAAQAQTEWKPTHPVEIVVGVGPGGGIDRTARIVQKILQERHLVDVPVTVTNKPGGGGTLSQAYLAQHPGDAHYLEISATSLLTNHLTGKSPHGYRDCTPVAMLYDEYIGFAVRSDSPIANGKALLDVFKRDPQSLPIGIATTVGNTNHIAAGLVADAAGADVRKLKIVVFNSGGESMTALLGGHTGLVVTPSANLIPHVQAGRMRALAVSSPARLAGPLSIVPTWKEQGVNAVVANWRPVVGSPGWTPAQIAYWERVFAQVTASPEWKAEVERVGGVNHYMGSRELAAYFEAQERDFGAILAKIGLLKNAAAR
jgi:putative tricarboxylic transport membrane protein